MSEVWKPSEGHLIEPKCVKHDVKGCFTCGCLTPLIERLNAEESEAAKREEISRRRSGSGVSGPNEPTWNNSGSTEDVYTEDGGLIWIRSGKLMSPESESIRRIELLSMDPETAEEIDRDRKL